MSVDGTDFSIQEPWPYNKTTSAKWFSKKFQGPGLRYEVGVAVENGYIVWINGPFLPGKFNDHMIFERMGLLSNLEEGERIEADDGYLFLDPEFVKARSSVYHPRENQDMRNTLRARHETVNRRLKVFRCLSSKFHHTDLGKHQDCFNAVAVLVLFAIDRGEQTYDLLYK